MKVLVTGGCGYIGSVISQTYKLQGHTVFVIDKENRPHTLIGLDKVLISDFSSVDSLSAIKKYEPDIIVHCAGTSLVGPSMLNPAEYYNNNIKKTITLLNEIITFPKRPVFLFSSSASVYGEPEVLPISEESLIKPISPYGNTKAMTEAILQDYYLAYGLRSMCFRYFNAAGAVTNPYPLGQEPNATHIVARVLEACLKKEKFALYGNHYDTPDGTCIRDYVHVLDIATAHIMGAEYIESNPGAYVLNLGSSYGISNKQIVDHAIDNFGLMGFDVVSNRTGDPARLIADSSKATKLLNWEPKHSSLNNIMITAYNWYQHRSTW